MPPIKAIALDFDGVLTDGGFWWGPDGAEWKRLSFADVMGVSMARKAGLLVTIISGEDSPLVDRFAAKMKLTDITKGCKDKALALAAFARRQNLVPAEICFMGDDVNDLAAMELAGLAAAPANARPAALRKADLITTAHGGNGAVRELVDLVLAGGVPLPAAADGIGIEMKLSDYVMQFVAAEGVGHVFLVTGGGAMHLNASLAQCPDLEPVCNSHEQASAMAAENYAKATNNLGVALVTTGPGGTNAITGVAGAWLDSTPLLVISGQVKRPDRMFSSGGAPLGMRQLGVQEVDIVSIVKPITKYAATVLDPTSIRYHLEKAVWLARNGRPGPVWIDIPLDVQASPIDENNLRSFDPVEIEPGPNCDLEEKVRETIDALNQAQRPLIFVGNGVRLAHAEEDFRRLFARLGVPVEATWCAADIISSEDPLFVGRPGSLASRGANFALQNCDFLLILGARMDFAITGYAPERLARAAHKVMVDIDPAEIRKLAPYIQTEIPADAGEFLREMLRRIAEVCPKDRTCWNKRCADWKTRYPVVLPEHRSSEGRVSIFHLAEVIGQETSPADLMVSGNAGSGIEIFLFACPTRAGQRIYHMAGLGAMGCGLPMSIGVCLAGGRSRTVCVDGDGGFQFNIQELATVRQLDLPIKFFILNNDGYASIRASQTAFFGSPQVGCDESTGLLIPPLAKLADAYRIPCVRIATPDRLGEQVRRVLDLPGPVLCDVEVIPDEPRVPRLSSMQRPDGSLVSKPLEDLFPFLDRDEFHANMIVAPIPE